MKTMLSIYAVAAIALVVPVGTVADTSLYPTWSIEDCQGIIRHQ